MTIEGTGNFMKGMAAGVVVGAAVSMIGDRNPSHRKSKLQKRTQSVLKNIGDVIDSAVDLIK